MFKPLTLVIPIVNIPKSIPAPLVPPLEAAVPPVPPLEAAAPLVQAAAPLVQAPLEAAAVPAPLLPAPVPQLIHPDKLDKTFVNPIPKETFNLFRKYWLSKHHAHLLQMFEAVETTSLTKITEEEKGLLTTLIVNCKSLIESIQLENDPRISLGLINCALLKNELMKDFTEDNERLYPNYNTQQFEKLLSIDLKNYRNSLELNDKFYSDTHSFENQYYNCFNLLNDKLGIRINRVHEVLKQKILIRILECSQNKDQADAKALFYFKIFIENLETLINGPIETKERRTANEKAISTIQSTMKSINIATKPGPTFSGNSTDDLLVRRVIAPGIRTLAKTVATGVLIPYLPIKYLYTAIGNKLKSRNVASYAQYIIDICTYMENLLNGLTPPAEPVIGGSSRVSKKNIRTNNSKSDSTMSKTLRDITRTNKSKTRRRNSKLKQ